MLSILHERISQIANLSSKRKRNKLAGRKGQQFSFHCLRFLLVSFMLSSSCLKPGDGARQLKTFRHPVILAVSEQTLPTIQEVAFNLQTCKEKRS